MTAPHVGPRPCPFTNLGCAKIHREEQKSAASAQKLTCPYNPDTNQVKIKQTSKTLWNLKYQSRRANSTMLGPALVEPAMTREVLETYDIEDTRGRFWALHPENPIRAVEFNDEAGNPLREPRYTVAWNYSKVTESQLPEDTIREYWSQFEICRGVNRLTATDELLDEHRVTGYNEDMPDY